MTDPNVASKLAAVSTYLNDSMYEREEHIEAVLAALVSGHHVFLLGPPGAAKTMLVSKLSECFEGSKYFHRLITPTVKPTDLFGPYSLPQLKEGKRIRETDGFLPDADFAYLDELWKGNGQTLNELLTPINERKFNNGNSVMNLPLRTVFASSNETPASDSLEALYDRFAVRLDVGYLKSSQNFRDMLLNPPSGLVAPKLNLSDIDIAKADARSVKVSEEFMQNIILLRSKFSMEPELNDIVVSDRRWRMVLDVAKASAYLKGSNELTGDDIRFTTDCLWSEPDQITKIRSQVLSLCSEGFKQAEVLLTKCQAVYQQAAGSNERNRLMAALSELEKQIQMHENNPHPELKKAVRQAKVWGRKLTAEADRMNRTFSFDTESAPF